LDVAAADFISAHFFHNFAIDVKQLKNHSDFIIFDNGENLQIQGEGSRFKDKQGKCCFGCYSFLFPLETDIGLIPILPADVHQGDIKREKISYTQHHVTAILVPKHASWNAVCFGQQIDARDTPSPFGLSHTG
jgi:hypothetical protein